LVDAVADPTGPSVVQITVGRATVPAGREIHFRLSLLKELVILDRDAYILYSDASHSWL